MYMLCNTANESLGVLEIGIAVLLVPFIFSVFALIIRYFQKKKQPKWNGVLLEEIMAALDPEMISNRISKSDAYEALCGIIHDLQCENEMLRRKK